MKDKAAIFAGGLSMNKDIADKVIGAGIYAVAINNSWEIAPNADVLLAADPEWWMEYPEAQFFKGDKIVMRKEPTIPSVRFVQPEIYGRGSNSALQAACWLDRMGTEQVLLFGVDLRDDELTHHHGQHRGALGVPTAEGFARSRKAWAEFAKTKRAEVINCSERSALRCFQKMSLSEVL